MQQMNMKFSFFQNGISKEWNTGNTISTEHIFSFMEIVKLEWKEKGVQWIHNLWFGYGCGSGSGNGEYALPIPVWII